ncbi:MAG: hypothetical protein QG670_1966 [Thermoproteota archaeon]|nr:hypothetical protein [Thermoproteota archaeon]
MKAALLYGPRDLRVEVVDIPQMTDDFALIKIMACGVCPTDLRTYIGSRASTTSGPRRIGHEWVGEVIEVGKNITRVKVGDRVAINNKIPCGNCYYCTNGADHLCTNLFGAGRVISGGDAQYGVATDKALYQIPDNVSWEEAAFAEPVSCVMNGIDNCNIKLGDDVLIVGAGPMGLLNMQIAKLKGGRIIMSDIIDERLAKAKEMGADEVINSSTGDFTKMVKDLTGGRGADVVVVSVGNRIAETQGLSAAGKNSTVIFFGGTWPETKIEIDPNFFHYNEVKLTGSSNFNYGVFPRSLKLMSSKLIKLEPIISHRLPLDRVKEGFELVEKKGGMKVMISPHA